MRPLDAWLNEVFRAACADGIRTGFEVSGGMARRRHGSTTQAIGACAHKRSHADLGLFFVEVAVSFDELRAAGDEKDIADWTARLHRLVPESPQWWELRPSTDRAALAERLRAALRPVFERLEAIDGAGAGAVRLPDHAQDLEVRARLRILAGDEAGALRDLIELRRTYLETDIAAIARKAGMVLDPSTLDPNDVAMPEVPYNQGLRRDWERLNAPPVHVHVGPPEAPPPSDVVEHPKFGEGRVLSREGEGPTAKLRIRFADGVKVLQQQFVHAPNGAPSRD